ncbi:MAG: hypothetical protein J6B36_00710 [Muribaculaceae bacterium]|nr:hypothetical protein [Muribaculaceae bacterium]
MKKFYSLAIAALVAVSSVSAQGLKQLSKGGLEKFNKVATTQKLSIDAPSRSIKSVGTKDIDISDISGNYAWSYLTLVGANAGEIETIGMTITKVTGNSYTITTDGWTFGATFSVLSKTLTIKPNQDLGYNEYNQMQVYLYNLNYNSAAAEDENPFSALNTPLTAQINGDSFVFDTNAIIGIGNIDKGWFTLATQNVISVAEGVVWDNYQILPEDGWVDAGSAMFADAWMIPGAGVDPGQYAYEVAVEKNENIPGMYRLVNPYLNSPMSNNDPVAEGFIAFSIADPEFVPVVPLSYCGFTAALQGGTTASLLPTNLEGYFLYFGDNYTKEEIIAGLSTEDEPFVPSSFDDATGTVTLKNCRWATIDEPTKNYVWSLSATESAVQEGWIKFNDWAGINGISVDNEDAPVEYYNLQGIRINNVENNPGLYIRKQGDKATKVFVK